MAAHVIVVDDDADLRETVGEYLARNGFEVSEAADAAELRAQMQHRVPDLVILDLQMPGEDGLSLARWLRGSDGTGIIMLTARGDGIDRIVGLEIGADDYVAKPFDPRELLARVRSVLRRIGRPAAAPGAEPAGRRVAMGHCLLDIEGRRLFDRDGREVQVTAMEFDLLRVFAERPGRVLSRDQLLDLAHSREMEAFDRSIDLRIMRLRRKIEVDPVHPSAIKTVRGQGYLFAPAPVRGP